MVFALSEGTTATVTPTGGRRNFSRRPIGSTDASRSHAENFAVESRRPESETIAADEADEIQHIFQTGPERRGARQIEMPLAQDVREVPAVVGALDEISVVLNCQLPDGMTKIRVPLANVPDELRRYGATVSVSVDLDAVGETLAIRAREVDGARIDFDDRRDVEAWLSLET